MTMLEEEVARYTESHHIILCGEIYSRTCCAPDYDSNRPNNILNVINKYGNVLTHNLK